MNVRIFYFILCSLLPLIFGAADNNSPYLIDESYIAKAVNPRISFIVLHFTHGNFQTSLNTLTHSEVSSHYLIPQTPINEKNVIYRLVQDDLRASHAGLSYWQGQYNDGQINLNASSIGIELVNLGFKDENNTRLWFAYTDHQIELLINLLTDLVKKYNIEPTRIIGHSDITPNIVARGANVRVDPGPLFPWEKLAAAGIGAWFDRESVDIMLKNNPNQDIDILWLQNNLAIYGYNIQPTGILDQQTRNVVTAFQMHFRPSDYSGTPDQETCAILKSLVDIYF